MELNRRDYSMISSLVIAGVVSRLFPHPANMALVAGAAIFAGSKLNKLSSVLVPLSIMFVSDLIIGLHTTMIFTWGSFVVIALLANYLLHQKNTVLRIVFTTFTSSVIFFVISNFGVWLVGHMYTHTFPGLITCFINALPFFRNTIVGDAIYTASIFGIYEVSKIIVSKKYFVTS